MITDQLNNGTEIIIKLDNLTTLLAYTYSKIGFFYSLAL